METETQVAIFSGGCFWWCTEAIFADLKGVIMVTPSHTGGRSANFTYQQVCSGNTGLVEVARIEYDPALISYNDHLEVFFSLTTRPRLTTRATTTANNATLLSFIRMMCKRRWLKSSSLN